MSRSGPDIATLMRSYPGRFRSDRASGQKVRIHFGITGAEGRDFTVEISDDNCFVYEGHQGQADCTVSAAFADFIAVETGRLPAQTAFLQGLIQISDPAVMLGFAKCFRPFAKAEEAPESGKPSAKQDSATERKPVAGPLVGLRVLDLSRLAPGPLATMMMADMGAEVIKIEDPVEKDYVRDFPPRVALESGQGDEAAYYLAMNRSKKSVLIDTRSSAGSALFLDLVETADVVVESFRPGVLDQAGIGYKAAKARNPGIIYTSITGYGQSGPYADMAGHDLNYVGYAGLLAVQGNGLGEPAQPGVQMADFAGGSYSAVMATLAAVFARQQTGLGQHIDISMTDCVMPLLTIPMAGMFASGVTPQRDKMVLSGAYPNYGIYRTKDGGYMALGALEPKFWSRFCEAAGVPDWSNRIAQDNPEELKKDLEQLFLQQTREVWVKLGIEADCCLSPVRELDELAGDPNISHRGMIHEFSKSRFGPLRGMGVPWKFSETPAHPSWPAPQAGADTFATLRDLGLSQTRIEEMKRQGIVG